LFRTEKVDTGWVRPLRRPVGEIIEKRPDQPGGHFIDPPALAACTTLILFLGKVSGKSLTGSVKKWILKMSTTKLY
jgi:hypothetical protein